MKHRLTYLVLALLFLFSVPAAAHPEVTVEVDGEALAFDVPPVIIQERTMVPMRAIFERLGAEVDWVQEEQIIIAVKGSLFVSLKIGSETMIVQDVAEDAVQTKILLDSPPVLVDSRALVPVRAVSDSLGAAVEWIPETYTVQITTQEARSRITGQGEEQENTFIE